MSQAKSSTRLSYLAAAVAMALALCVRIRLLPVPLERDEGEFAYIGQLLLKGVSPFVHAYSMKLPGASGVYALFISLFGPTPSAIHLGLLLVNLACAALLFLLGRRLFDTERGALAAGCYAVLSVSQSVYGAHAHATHFAILFSLAGLVLLLKGIDRRSIFFLVAAGLSFGLAYTMKQHALLFALFALFHLLWRDLSRAEDKRFFIVGSLGLLAALVIPYLLILLATVKAGSFDNFWFWTFKYPRAYVSEQGAGAGIGNFFHTFEGLLLLQFPFWVLAGAGCYAITARRGTRGGAGFVFGFLIFSFLAICPGFYFREHYFVLLLPAVALLAAAGAAGLPELLSKVPGGLKSALPLLAVCFALAYSVYLERDYFFTLTPTEVSRATYDENPFPEAVPVARYLREHTSPEDRIAVLGSEPEIYFYADRLSATGHIYMYGLMENQPHAEEMQQQMIREVESARPKYVVMVNVRKSWLGGPESKGPIMAWRERYLRDGYDLVGVTDIISSTTTKYLWEKEAAGYTPASHAYLTVFKRRPVQRSTFSVQGSAVPGAANQ